MMIHSTIIDALKSDDHQKAFKLSKGHNPAVFFNPLFFLVEKKKWELKREFWKYFFQLDNSSLVSTEFFLSISKHFWKSYEHDSELINQFATVFPKPFIDSLRIQQKFLKEGLIENIDNAIPELSSYVGEHLDKMQTLRSKNILLRKSIESGSYQEKLKKTSFEKLLMHIIVWWENSLHTIEADDEKFRAIDYLITLFLKVKENITSIDQEIIIKPFISEMNRKVKKNEKVFIYPLLDKIVEAQRFETTELASYCHELIHDFDESGNWVFSKRYKTKFQQEGEKLRVFESWLFIDAMSITEKLIETGELNLKAKDELDESYKSYNHDIGFKTELLFDYVSQFQSISEEDRLVILTYSSIHTHAISRYNSKIKPLQSAFGIIPSFLKLVLEKENGFPIKVVDHGQFKNMIQSSFTSHQVNEEHLDHIIKSLSKDINTVANIDLLTNPVLNLGDQYMWLLPLVGSQNIMWGSFINYLSRIDESKQQECDKNFESAIGKLYTEHQFNVEHTLDLKEFGEKSGDIDVIIKEGNRVLVFEVKRTKFRYDSSGINDERMERFKKASLQLYKHTDFIKRNNQFREKWSINENTTISYFIVSPWFEHDHEEIEGFMKISWFEIKTILNLNIGDWKSAENRLERIIKVVHQELAWDLIFKKVSAAESMITQ